ncbi:thioredoxin [Pseudomonas sp. MWU12-2115]|uniref:thioredoxin family protein n=1 Tax=unclassified Pseudomonas TaxID=196821 RepID=UPI000CD4EE1C|nr:thioredoxin family protein [Pseudomonas sp. MWU12-2020]RBB99550.1 thioredoxin [Pseudomonas sp. MWU12-2115]
MSAANTISNLAPVYRKALKTWRPVILYFANEHCPACEWAGPVFREVAEPYRLRANIYMLNTREAPRHPLVTGTPTVLFYKNGKLMKKLKGIGTEETLSEDFARHVGKTKAPAVIRPPRHDLAWLRRTLRTLCTVPRAHRWNFS